MDPNPTRRASLTLFAGVQLLAVSADRLKQFTLVSMVGLLAPGSAIELLKLNLFMQVPMLLFTPAVGTLLDRWRKPDAILAACVTRAAILVATPALFGMSESLYTLYVIAAFLSVADLVFAPARSALLPEIVSENGLLQANAWFWVLGVLGTLGGFIAGGWIFDNLSWRSNFHGTSVLYLLAAMVMIPVLIAYARRHREHAQANAPITGVVGAARSIVRSISDSVQLIREDRNIAICLGTQCSLFAMGGILSVVAIARVQEVSPPGQATFLSIIAASLVVGMIAGSGLSGLFRDRVSVRRTVAVSTLLCGVAIAGFGRNESILPLSIWAGVLGLSMSPVFIVTETMIQHNSPREYMGRVFAAREALIKTAYLIAAVIGTAATTAASKSAILVALGLFLALLGVVLERSSWLNTTTQGGRADEHGREDA